MNYADPYVPGPIEVEGGPLRGVQLSPALVREHDLLVITTAHAAFDWPRIREHSGAVLDARGWSRGQQLAGWHTL